MGFSDGVSIFLIKKEMGIICESVIMKTVSDDEDSLVFTIS